jgi:hypothetical protein
MLYQRTASYCLLSLLFVLFAASAGAGDRLHVINSEAALPPLTIELEELWRAGGDDQDSDLMFGLPVEAIADANGKVYLADQQLCQVFVFGPNGEFEGTLSREGEGPGEVNGPVDLVQFPDGNFGLAEFFPGKIIKVTPEDLPAGEITVDVTNGETGGFTMQVMAEAKGNNLLIAGSRSVPKEKVLERVHFLASLDSDGKQLVRYMEQVSHIERPHPIVHENDFLPSFPLASALG